MHSAAMKCVSLHFKHAAIHLIQPGCRYNPCFLRGHKGTNADKKKSKSEVILFALQTWGIQEDSFKALK